MADKRTPRPRPHKPPKPPAPPGPTDPRMDADKLVPREVMPQDGVIDRDDGVDRFFHENGDLHAELLNTPDGPVLNGAEFIVTQKKDPPQLRLAIWDEQQRLAGGAIAFCRQRNDGRYETVAMIQGGNLDQPDPNNPDAGMLKFMIRVGPNDDTDWRTVFVATTDYNGGVYWTGLGNFKGDLYKFANAGDLPPYSTSGGAPTPPTPTPPPTNDTHPNAAPGRFFDGGNKLCFQCQSDQSELYPAGRIVVYDMHGSTDEGQWTHAGTIIPEPASPGVGD